jgi:uncharacterized membrane protein YkoI
VIVKRALICATVMAAAFATVGCGRISSEKAISVALADQGIDRIGAASTKAVLDKANDPEAYKVVIDLNTHYENYVVDAKTGAIISHETQAK